jgi:hypothetical protein
VCVWAISPCIELAQVLSTQLCRHCVSIEGASTLDGIGERGRRRKLCRALVWHGLLVVHIIIEARKLGAEAHTQRGAVGGMSWHSQGTQEVGQNATYCAMLSVAVRGIQST